MTTGWDMTTPGAGSNSRLNSAKHQQGSTDNADRLLRERRAGSSAVSYADVYEERAARKEAEQSELEALRVQQKTEADRRKREELGERWSADYDLTVSCHSGPADEIAAARKSLDEFTQRAEGEELAARIVTGILRPGY
ncbi:hypothetical protein AB0E00_27450 [Streptomyces sp. NPDC048110]|uniref:hypothetical protein n=1 Tax=Streptomyces sp. NPDC048110 TaxID=3155483 RepID=UPI0033F430C7